jgi:hypothetical protein
MNGFTAKFAGECPHARILEVAVGDNHVAVVADLAGRQMNIPVSVRSLSHSLNLCLERHESVDTEMMRIVFEIFQKPR